MSNDDDDVTADGTPIPRGRGLHGAQTWVDQVVQQAQRRGDSRISRARGSHYNRSTVTRTRTGGSRGGSSENVWTSRTPCPQSCGCAGRRRPSPTRCSSSARKRKSAAVWKTSTPESWRTVKNHIPGPTRRPSWAGSTSSRWSSSGVNTGQTNPRSPRPRPPRPQPKNTPQSHVAVGGPAAGAAEQGVRCDLVATCMNALLPL